MKRFVKDISVLLILTLLVGMVSAATPGLAASAWEFRTKTGIVISVDGSIQMKKNEFQDFNLYNNDSEITTNHAKYSVSWSSSDTKVIWIDKNNGKARADKNKGMSSVTGEAVITATITNKQTGAKIYRRFTVAVGSQTNVSKLAIEFTDGTTSDQTLEIGKSYKLKSVTYDKNGKALTFAQTKLYRTYFGTGIKNGVFKADKEGTYTLTVAAYKSKTAAAAATSAKDAVITGILEVTVGNKSPKMTSIKQSTLDSVELTFNQASYAKKLIENPNLLLAYSSSGSYQIRNYVKSITAKSGDDKTVIITMYAQLTEKTTYKFEYSGEKDVSITMESASLEPVYVKVVGGECVTFSYVTMQVKAYNSLNIEVPIGTNYTVTFNAPQTGDYSIIGNTIYFFRAQKTATVTATLEGYNTYGQKLPSLQGSGTYVSVDEITAIQKSMQGYAIGALADMTNQTKLKYNNEKKSICVGDTGMMVFACYNDTAVSTEKPVVKYIGSGSDSDLRTGYTYESTNSNCLLVSKTDGSLVPITPGETQIIIYKGQGKQVGSFIVEVMPKRVLQNLVVGSFDDRFSVTKTLNSNNSLRLDLSVLDQYGKEFDPSMVDYSFEIKHPAGQNFNSCFDVTRDGLDVILKENVGLFNIPTGTIQGYNIEVTARINTSSSTVKQLFSLAVKAVDTTAVSATQLIMSKSTVDTKLSATKPEDYNVEIKLKTIDANGYTIGDEPMNYITSAEGANTSGRKFSVLIMNGSTASTIPFELKNNALVLQPVKVEGTQIKKAPVGTYYVHLYRKDTNSPAQLIQSLTLTITDSTQQMVVEQRALSINTISTENVRNALAFYRDGVDISNYVTIDTYDIIPVSNSVHVSAVYVLVKATELNSQWNSNYYVREKIEVGKTFTVNY